MAATRQLRSPAKFLRRCLAKGSGTHVRRGRPMLFNRYLEMIKRMDWVLFSAMVALAVGSVFFIYSASYSVSGPASTHHGRLPIYQMQMVWFGVGLLIYLLSALIDYRLICQWASVWYVFAL